MPPASRGTVKIVTIPGMRFLVAVFSLARMAMAASPTCSGLTNLTITNTTVISADDVPAGPYTPAGAAASVSLPAFCRVQIVSRPVRDSEIRVELWLPAQAAWNGKFEGTGNGGFSGAMSYNTMATALNQGYATAGSDTGHEGDDLNFGVGHPEKIDDWAYRAVHVMTVTAKLIIRGYYGRLPRHAYFTGCSTGGQQALSEAQRFPADYDGIVAGDPGHNRVHLIAGFLWSWEAIHKDAQPLPAAKLPMIAKAVMAACDAIDGLEDGIIDDPRRCKFDPGTLLCKGADGDNCLTASQVESVKKVYSGAKNPRTGEQIFAGWALGTETNWITYFVDPTEARRSEFWRLWVFNDPKWDWRTFDFDRDVAYADRKMAVVNSVDANLKPFKARNGKLVMYHGWADANVPPEDGIHYYEAVERAMGGPGQTTDFFRLFMAPGMGHCSGGRGPNTFDALGAVDQWVERGKAPEKIVASHMTNGVTDRTRPLCPYPEIAKWSGAGSIDDAANFVCVRPARLPR
jgi:feruloyl esterase